MHKNKPVGWTSSA